MRPVRPLLASNCARPAAALRDEEMERSRVDLKNVLVWVKGRREKQKEES